MKPLIASFLALAVVATPGAAQQLARRDAVADPAARVRDLRQKAMAGDADAMLRLGDAYREGRGVSADLTAAEDWYRRAADAGSLAGADEYGLILFRTGRHGEAMPLLIRAAERGEARAQYIYGTALFNGDYVERDWIEAYAMMSRAAAAGIQAAATSLQQMNRYIPADQRRAGSERAAALQKAPGRAAPPPPRPIAREAAASKPVELASRTVTPALLPDPVKTAPPPPRPIAAKPVAPAAAGKWQVQLGAFSGEAKARSLWASLKSRVTGFDSLEPRLVPAGALTRLRAGPIADRASAERLCAAAAAKGQGCFPVAP